MLLQIIAYLGERTYVELGLPGKSRRASLIGPSVRIGQPVLESLEIG